MRNPPLRLGSLAVGALAAIVTLAYGVATDLVRLPATPGVPFGEVLVAATLAVVPFAVGAGAAALALRHRVVLPLVTATVFAVLPALLGWHADQVLVGVLVAGPFVVVVALGETLARAWLGRLRNPPTEAGYRALSVGVMAALLYFGVFALRAALPLWRLDTGAPATLPPAADLALTLWYVLGASLVLVGLPVALHRRFDLLAPLVGLVAYLLVDLAYLQPLVAEGAELVVVLLVGVWPLLAAAFTGVGAVEWWLRDRRGEYDEPEDDGDEGGEGGDSGEGGGLSLEGGLFGDRV
ncbi:hypothetical protein HWV07_12985 [Natronomonas salina]|uniref:hypothetical protein n=1 Tax=Natronomonas salina TaxID=1710540 RepID=UPI0015B74304|nr:hypothetical protein [Natronomonas salina]QLD89891.1 hypothetical protein HWV07_12985 [Natronomonas salina]